MAGTIRILAAAIPACLAWPSVAAGPGAIAERSRGAVTITASVAGQARLTGAGGALCLWSNTATRRIAVTAADADGTTTPIPGGAIVAAPTPDCTADAAAPGRLILTAAPGATATGAVAILVSPE